MTRSAREFCVHFGHYNAAMLLDGFFRGAQFGSDLFVEEAH